MKSKFVDKLLCGKHSVAESTQSSLHVSMHRDTDVGKIMTVCKMGEQ